MNFFDFIRALSAHRHGSFKGETKNVNLTKSGPGRMPPHRHQHKRSGRKLAKRYGQLALKDPR